MSIQKMIEIFNNLTIAKLFVKHQPYRKIYYNNKLNMNNKN